MPVIIIHYNTPALLARCLQALQAAPFALLPIVIDTSPEGARAHARQHVATLSTGRFISCKNHSLAHAVNTGLRAALPLSDYPALVCMNADVFVRPDAWEPLLNALQPPHVGMVGPVCYDGHGRWQHQGVGYQQYYLRLQYLRWMQRLEVTNLGVSNYVSVPWLSGCLQVIKRDALSEVGGMNSSLRFYNEDLEWCWRLRRAGWTCRLVDTSRAFPYTGSKPYVGSKPCVDSKSYVGSKSYAKDTHHPDHDDIYQQTQPVVHLGGSATPAQASFVVEGYRGGYRVSQMYRSPVYQTLHRIVLRALIQQRLAKQQAAQEPNEQRGFDALRRRLARGNLFDSPFGDTLAEDNPRFKPTDD